MEEERERKENEPVYFVVRICSQGYLASIFAERCPHCGEDLRDDGKLIRLLFEG